MAPRPLLNEDDPLDDEKESEPELIPPRKTRTSSFSQPFPIRTGWLIVLGFGIQWCLLDWSDWCRLIDPAFVAQTGSELFSNSLLLIIPLGLAWWLIRRWATRRGTSTDDSEDGVRLMDDQEEGSPLKLLALIAVYVIAVLGLIALSICRLVGVL